MDIPFDFIKNVLSQLPVIIFFKDTRSRYIFSTQYMDDLTGSEDENKTVLNKTDLELFKDPSNAQLSYETDRKVIETGQPVTYVIEETLDGENYYFKVFKNPVRDENGEITGIIGMILDITENVKAKQTLSSYCFIDTFTGLYSKKGFISNVKRMLSLTSVMRKSAVAAVISYIPGEREDSGYTETMCVANAIKMPITEEKVCARIETDIFGVLLLHDKTQTAEKCFAGFMSNVKSNLGKYSETAGVKAPELIADYKGLSNDDPSCAEEMFEELIGGVARTVNTGKSSFFTYKNTLIDLRDRIYREPERNWNISEIAADIGVSKSHFFRMYKKLHFTSCTDDIIDARLKKACNMLRYTDMHVGEIASHCGYKSESFFMRQFRGKIGVTAIQYRRKYKS